MIALFTVRGILYNYSLIYYLSTKVILRLVSMTAPTAIGLGTALTGLAQLVYYIDL